MKQVEFDKGREPEPGLHEEFWTSAKRFPMWSIAVRPTGVYISFKRAETSWWVDDRGDALPPFILRRLGEMLMEIVRRCENCGAVTYATKDWKGDEPPPCSCKQRKEP